MLVAAVSNPVGNPYHHCVGFGGGGVGGVGVGGGGGVGQCLDLSTLVLAVSLTSGILVRE